MRGKFTVQEEDPVAASYVVDKPFKRLSEAVADVVGDGAAGCCFARIQQEAGEVA